MAEELCEHHPAIAMDAGVLCVEEERVFTSAGRAAGIDLMLHPVRNDFGVEAANSVARCLVMPAHRGGGQAQFIEQPVPRDRANHLAGLMAQVRADLRMPWTLERMAQAGAMSPRTLLRRFTEATSQSPGDWLIAERVAEAQRLTEASALPTESVAAEAGIGCVQALRHRFQARLGLAPRAYRASFGRSG